VLSLGTGQAILFAPNALCLKKSVAHQGDTEPSPKPLGQGYLVVRSRLRVTLDGGHSLLAVQDSHHATRLGRVAGIMTGSTGPGGSNIITSHSTAPAAGISSQNAPLSSVTSAFASLQVKQIPPPSVPAGSWRTRARNPVATTPEATAKAAHSFSEKVMTTSSCARGPSPGNQTVITGFFSQDKGKQPAVSTSSSAENYSADVPPSPSSSGFSHVDSTQSVSQTTTSPVKPTWAQHRPDAEGKPFAAIQRYLSQLLLDGHKVAKYEDTVLDLVGHDQGRPYRSADELLAVVHAASLEGQLQLIEERGSRWLALPGILWSLTELTSGNIAATDLKHTGTSDRPEDQALRVFHSVLTTESQAGVPWVTWKTFKRSVFELDVTQPYKTKKKLLAAVTLAAARGDIRMKGSGGDRYFALPGVPVDKGLTSSSQPASASSSHSNIAYSPILSVVADAHGKGFPLVGYSYVAAQVVKGKKVKLHLFEKALTGAIRTGEILVTIVEHNPDGRWFYLPDDSVHRLPVHGTTRHIPAPGDPDEFNQLLACLPPPHERVLRKSVRNHFRKQVPDTPYGQDAAQLDRFLARAQEKGLIMCGGSGKREAWVQRA
jgi:hypothetical protein